MLNFIFVNSYIVIVCNLIVPRLSYIIPQNLRTHTKGIYIKDSLDREKKTIIVTKAMVK